MELLFALTATLSAAAIATAIVWRVTNPDAVEPQWVPTVGLAMTIGLLLASFAFGDIWNVASFSLLAVTYAVWLAGWGRRGASR